ncbi:MAG: right-handed parallel beta-helix repeat-containing protein [Candidatus Thorarchaeota archaeon]
MSLPENLELVECTEYSYTKRVPVAIFTNDGFSAYGFPGSGTSSDPYRIEGWNITSSSTCIAIQDTSAHFIIQDCILTAGSEGYGVEIFNAFNGVVRNNTIFGSCYGVTPIFSSFITIEDNNLFDNLYGVVVDGSLDATVRNNIISGSTYSLCVGGDSSATLEDNTIIGGTYGMLITASLGVSTVNNTVSDSVYGMYLWRDASNVDAINNTITGAGVGIYLASTTHNNIFYYNRMVENNIHANDDGTNNHWNTTGIGNYWSDYSGSGVYPISGIASSIDYHPFVYDTDPPVVETPSNITYTVGESGNTITWVVQEDNPSHYEILLNDDELITEEWNGSSVTINVDGLEIGIYSYRVIFYDTFSNVADDDITVSVQAETTLPPISSSLPSTTYTGENSNTSTTSGLLLNDLDIGYYVLISIEVIVIIAIVMRFRKSS